MQNGGMWGLLSASGKSEQVEKMGQRETQSKGSGLQQATLSSRPPPARLSSPQFNQMRGESKLRSGGPAAA